MAGPDSTRISSSSLDKTLIPQACLGVPDAKRSGAINGWGTYKRWSSSPGGARGTGLLRWSGWEVSDARNGQVQESVHHVSERANAPPGRSLHLPRVGSAMPGDRPRRAFPSRLPFRKKCGLALEIVERL